MPQGQLISKQSNKLLPSDTPEKVSNEKKNQYYTRNANMILRRQQQQQRTVPRDNQIFQLEATKIYNPSTE